MSVVAATMRTAFADSWANRKSFGVQLIFMMINDTTWIVFWGLFFNRIGHVRGWQAHDVFVMLAILLTASGLALGLFSNCRRIGLLIAEGALDETLSLPMSPLTMLLTKRVDPGNVGDLAFGPIVFALFCAPTPERVALYGFGSLVGAVVLVSFLTLSGALTLFAGGRGEQADLAFNAIVIFASYPLDFFGGATSLILFTVVPAAFVTGLPARLVRSFDPATAVVMVVMAALLAVLAWAVFTLGLHRYSSGSVWSR